MQIVVDNMNSLSTVAALVSCLGVVTASPPYQMVAESRADQQPGAEQPPAVTDPKDKRAASSYVHTAAGYDGYSSYSGDTYQQSAAVTQLQSVAQPAPLQQSVVLQPAAVLPVSQTLLSQPTQALTLQPVVDGQAPHPLPMVKTVPVPYAVPVPVPEPYPVHVPVHIVKTVTVPVEKPVPYPVERPVPYPVDKPYPVTVEKKILYAVPKPYPVPVPIYKIIYKEELDKYYRPEKQYDHKKFMPFKDFFNRKDSVLSHVFKKDFSPRILSPHPHLLSHPHPHPKYPHDDD